MVSKTSLVIIGAGPAGLAAANVAGGLGIDTLIIDDQQSAGGQIYRGVANSTSDLRDVLGSEYQHGRTLLAGLEHACVTWQSQSAVWQITQDGLVYFSGPKGSAYVQAEQVILATGALERAMPFPGWTLPGVMTAGGLQIALKTAGLVPDGNLVLAGSGPLLLLLAWQILNAGGEISTLVETTPQQNKYHAIKYFPDMLRAGKMLREGVKLLWQIRKKRIRHYAQATSLSAIGKEKIEGLRFTCAGQTHELACDVLAVHNGVVPNVQVSRQLGLTHDWQDHQRCWYPRVGQQGETELDWLKIAGDGGGIYGARAAEYQGAIAAWSAAQALGKSEDSKARQMIDSLNRNLAPLKSARQFIDCLYSPAKEFLLPADETIVCRCEEVTAKDIRHYVDLGCTGPNQTKAFGRPGMGPCQGRYCGLTVSELIAESRGVSTNSVGYYRIRPPIKPVTIAELASLHDDE